MTSTWSISLCWDATSSQSRPSALSVLRVADARHGHVDKGRASQPSYQRVTPESNTGLLLPEGNFLAGETEISDVCFVFSDPDCWHVTGVKI